MIISSILDTNKAHIDSNNIWVAKMNLTDTEETSKRAWEDIFSFDTDQLLKDRKDVVESKLKDHTDYVDSVYTCNKDNVFLEIGCGPAYIGEYYMEKYGAFFIGVDFNYPMLRTLDAYLKSKKYKNYALVYADVANMPLISNSVDFIYGGGVIEHLRSTDSVVQELYRVTKTGGVSFNTVPALNLSWLSRFYNNIPSKQPLRSVAEFIHITLLKNAILEKNFGYALSFSQTDLKNIHFRAGFSKCTTGAFAFHPSHSVVPNKHLRDTYFELSKKTIFSPMYYINAIK